MLERSYKLLSLILILVGFLTFFNSFGNQFIWDDFHFISQNLFIQKFDIIRIFTSNTTAGGGVSSNYYRPFTSLTFAIDSQIWHTNVFGFHLTNILFHIANALLIFWILKKLKLHQQLAFLVSMVFLVHPVQVEAVTYLSSRGDVLYTFFCLVSLISFIYSLDGGIKFRIFKKKINLPNKSLFTLSIVTQILSILSKEAGLINVLSFIGVFLIFKQQKRLDFNKLHSKYRNQFITILMVGLISIIYFILRLTVLNFGDSLNYSGLNDVYTSNIWVRLLTFLKIFLSYVGWIIWPTPLYFERTTSIVTSINPLVLASLGLIILATGLGILEAKKFKTYWTFFGLLIIFANLIPVSGIIPQTALSHENWLYLPVVGFGLVIFTLTRFLPVFKNRTLLGFSSIYLISLLMGLTVKQNMVWKDPITFYEYNLKFANTARLHLNLGNAYINQNNWDLAIYHFNQAVLIDDSFPQTHFNLGYVYQRKNQDQKAEAEWLKSLEFDPNYLYSYRPLIDLYVRNNRPELALPYLKRLTLIYPTDFNLLTEYGGILYWTGKKDEAEKYFNQAIDLSNHDPNLIKAIIKLKSQKP